MTNVPVQDMTPEQVRREIAERLGWRVVEKMPGLWVLVKPNGEEPWMFSPSMVGQGSSEDAVW